MLVLSRQRDETIMIGDDIEVTLVDIRGDKVRLGINAPTRIAVHRKEVWEAIKAENERAASVMGAELPRLAGSVGERDGGRLARLGIVAAPMAGRTAEKRRA
ncbi:MAG: carbon storage regulator CsrA [Planctomycetota bacterium]